MQHFKTTSMSDSIAALTSDDALTLEYVLSVLRQRYDDERTVQHLVRTICLETTSEDIKKKGMEFLYVSGYYDDLQRLITRNQSSESASSRQWADVYQLKLARKNRQYPANDILKRACACQVEEPELECLLEFIKTSIYFRKGEYGKLGNIMAKQQNLFDKINHGFLFESFNSRLHHNLFIYYLARNEVIMARKFAFRVLNRTTNPETKISLHMGLGLSYIFDTYHQAMYHFNEGLKIALVENLGGMAKVIKQQNIPFISAQFNQVEGVTSTDKSEQAHIAIARGDYAEAESILDDIDINSPFRMYYLGMAKQDETILFRSYNQFIEKRSDYFYSRLPLNALQIMKG